MVCRLTSGNSLMMIITRVVSDYATDVLGDGLNYGEVNFVSVGAGGHGHRVQQQLVGKVCEQF